MRVQLCIAFALAFASATPSTFAAEKPETPHLVFVREYIRGLAAIEDIRSSGERRLKQAAKDDTFSNLIYTGTRMQFELRAQIAALKDMHLNPPFEELIAALTDFDRQKVALYQKLVDISSAFIGSPKPGVDYDKLAAEVPKTRAALDYIDQSVFEATPLVFAMLIDQKADSKNHVSHLNITKAERAQLLSDIATSFGSKLDQNDTTYIVSAASLLKANLLKDFKSSDEPWE
jgi:hypothetical protein